MHLNAELFKWHLSFTFEPNETKMASVHNTIHVTIGARRLLRSSYKPLLSNEQLLWRTFPSVWLMNLAYTVVSHETRLYLLHIFRCIHTVTQRRIKRWAWLGQSLKSQFSSHCAIVFAAARLCIQHWTIIDDLFLGRLSTDCWLVVQA